LIRDLVGTGSNSVVADVLVIGAGTVGLVIAARLAQKRLKVVVFESGGLKQDEEEHPLNEVVHLRSEYPGAAHGRFRCLGGTSTRWGGALIPFLAADVNPDMWPIPHGEITSYLSAVEELFGLHPGPYEFPTIVGPSTGQHSDHIARLAKWPPFSKRNVANLLSREIRSATGPTVWLNATATTFDINDGRLHKVTAQAPDKSNICVHAKEVVLAAGAIESTRLLLLLDRQNGNSICAPDDQLGRFFYDHLSVMVARLEARDRKVLNRVFGFRFEKGGVMRNVRFELADKSKLRGELPLHFAHVAFQERKKSGFNALREFFRYAQQRRIPTFSTFMQIAISMPWLARAIWWRLIEKRLLYPSDAELQVHMVIEQVPSSVNRITLSDTRKDPFGQPLAVIDWSVGREDSENMTKATDAFQKTWERSQLAEIASFIRRPAGHAEAELGDGGGIYHPGGSTRMGKTQSQAVVDRDLRLFRLPNVSVVATSVFPRGGGANPTMMLMMLALRSIDSIANRVGRQ